MEEIDAETQAQFDKLLELYGPEDLEPELEEYLSEMPGLGYKLQHPLVYHVPFSHSFSKMANRLFREKQEALEKARAEKNWSKIVFLHERPWRFQALVNILDDHLLADEVLWPLIGHMWTDSDNIHQNYQGWRDLWSDSTSQEQRMALCMKTHEQEAFRALPDRIPVFRGVQHTRAVKGLSWSTDRDKAVWFSRRYRGPSILASGMVDKSDVLAHFLDRNESEIVVFPEDVLELTTERL